MPPAETATLLPALERLDALLVRALDAAARDGWAAPGEDPFRGLYVAESDVDSLLARAPAEPAFALDGGDSQHVLDSPLAGTADAFGLATIDLGVVIVAAAPEVDLRYERLYGYLQDDVTRRRPTVDLALTLLCGSTRDRFAYRSRFTPDAPLVRHGIVRLGGDADTPLLARPLLLDECVLRHLVGDTRLEPRLAEIAELVACTPGLVTHLDEGTAAFVSAVAAARCERVVLTGLPDSGQREAAEALAGRLARPLLAVAAEDAPSETLAAAARTARLRGAVLYLDGAVCPQPAPPFVVEALHMGARTHGAPVLTLHESSPPTRRRAWRRELRAREVACPPRVVEDVAARFSLGPSRVAAAADDVAAEIGAGLGGTVREAVFRAARAQSTAQLGALAVRLEPRHGWEQLVLPKGSVAQLRELCLRVTERERVMVSWGFGSKLSAGKGASALFAGGSGTGKTMAAEVVAAELGLDLFRINLAGIVSKYIGETEKNLDRVFEAAAGSSAVLFFDEADALFGKRSEVRDSHDRYANIEVSYLLQKMEAYEGMAILASNLRDSLDEAFLRRLAAIVNFPFPDEEARARIWRVVWPEAAELDGDIDVSELAARFKLSGGGIKNVALAAAFLAAKDKTLIARRHVLRAVRGEFHKLGKALADVDLDPAPETV